MTRHPSLAAAALLLTLAPGTAQSVKVFVLAGQSNMEGKVQRVLLDHQAQDPKTRALFAHLYQDGKWRTRDDVFVKFLNRMGPLTVGFGSPDRTGVELEFGWTLGEHFEEPVLLIKTAWGGHSLYKLFRSPSAGMPPLAKLEKELADRVRRVESQNAKRQNKAPLPTMADVERDYGSSYRNMMQEVATVFADYEKLFPKLKGKRLELAGFVWFQGWNDQYNGAEREYATNMAHFIRDVRRELKAPKLPFVIGVMGQNGSSPAKGAMLTIQKAQLAMAEKPEFRGNVLAVRTDVLVDKAAEELYPNWRKNFEQWQKTGSDHKYHYLGSAIWHLRMGKAFANAMLELLGK